MLSRVLELPDPLIELTLLKLPPQTLCQLLLVNTSIRKLLLAFVPRILEQIEAMKKFQSMHWETNSTVSDQPQRSPSLNKLLDELSMIYPFIQEGGVYHNPITNSTITLHTNDQVMYIQGIIELYEASYHVLVYPTRTYLVSSYIYELNTENPAISLLPYESRINEAFFTEDQVFILDRVVLAVSDAGIEQFIPTEGQWVLAVAFPRRLMPSHIDARPFPVVVQNEVYILYFSVSHQTLLRIVHFNKHSNTFKTVMITGHIPAQAHTILDHIYVPDHANYIMFLPARVNYRMTVMTLTITTLNDTDIYAKFSTLTMPAITDYEYFCYIIRRDEVELFYIDKRIPANKTSYKLKVLEVDNQ